MHTRRAFPSLAAVTLAAALLAPACAAPKDVDDVPLGSDVSVVTTDGSAINGKLISVSGQDVVVQRENTGRRDTIKRTSIASVEEKTGETIADLVKPKPAMHDVTVPAGTLVPATLDVALGSDTNDVEDPVSATVQTPVKLDGVAAIPAGATLRGQVLSAEPAGKATGRASIAFWFDELIVDFRNYHVTTNHVTYRADTTPASTVAGGDRTEVVLTTPGEDIHLEPGAPLRLELTHAVTISVPNH